MLSKPRSYSISQRASQFFNSPATTRHPSCECGKGNVGLTLLRQIALEYAIYRWKSHAVRRGAITWLCRKWWHSCDKSCDWATVMNGRFGAIRPSL